MKKTKKIFSIIIFITVLYFAIQLNAFANNNTLTSDYASYTENEVITESNLGNDVVHKKVYAISTANSCTNPGGYSLIDSPQQVNVLSVPSVKDVRVINYTFPSTIGWSKKTLTQFVESYEKNNPGWEVVAAINGTFFDINGNNKALPYQANGTSVSDNNLLRTVESKSVGYTNDGSANSFIMTDKITFSENHQLEIYDSAGNIISKLNIDKLNEVPNNNEIALYFSYNENTTGNLVSVTTPNLDGYLCEKSIRCLPQSEKNIYATGEVKYNNQEITLNFGQFAIVSSNTEVLDLLSRSSKVRIQKDVTGDLANCDQVLGVGSTLVENGEISTNNSDGMREQRHPRTCIGKKADGTLMFFTVDGRQQDNNMYGMTEDELSVMMKYYGCVSGVNIDGGGSTTIGIKNEKGEFVITNSPSDGGQRNNSNALLIVIPTFSLSISNLTENSVNVNYATNSECTISNMKFYLNDMPMNFNENNGLISNLQPDTEYTLSYTYDIKYKDAIRNKKGTTINFKTGKISPTVQKAVFDIVDEIIKFNYILQDPNNLSSSIRIKYNRGVEFIDRITDISSSVNLSEFENLKIDLIIDYVVESTPNRNAQKKVQFNWYPENLDIEQYELSVQNKFNDIINQVNDTIFNLEINEAKTIILEAKKVILEMIEIERVNTEFKPLKINELYSKINGIDFSVDNKILVDNIISEAITEINNSNSEEVINEIVDKANIEVDKIIAKQKYEVELEELKKNKTTELNDFVDNEEYNEKNTKKANAILEKAIDDINSAMTKEEIYEIVDNTIIKLQNIKTKNCNSSTYLMLAILNCLAVLCIAINKKH